MIRSSGVLGTVVDVPGGVTVVGEVGVAVGARIDRRAFTPHRVVDARGDADRVRVVVRRPVEADARPADRVLDTNAAVTSAVKNDEGVVTAGAGVVDTDTGRPPGPPAVRGAARMGSWGERAECDHT